MSAAVGTSCCNVDCHRSFARPVRHCPFCGALQTVGNDKAVDSSIKVPPATDKATPVDIGDHAEEMVEPYRTEKTESVAESPPVSDVLSEPKHGGQQASLGNHAIKEEKKKRSRKTGQRVLFAVLSVTALVLVLRTIFHSATEAPITLEATAQADQWTSVDISKFGAGTRLFVSGDGPFRVRTASEPPILVSREPTALGQIHSSGFEVKSASGTIVHITISGISD